MSPPRTKEHGYAMYKRGCKCDVCRAANAAAQARKRQRRALKLLADPTSYVHGKASTYDNSGCRCDKCADAKNQSKLKLVKNEAQDTGQKPPDEDQRPDRVVTGGAAVPVRDDHRDGTLPPGRYDRVVASGDILWVGSPDGGLFDRWDRRHRPSGEGEAATGS